MNQGRRINPDCESYKPLPIGYANANFQGNRGNPYLDGIKTPKYQRSAPRPVSADVMAVNHSQMMGGVNKAGDAREMLNFYIKEAKLFKPPPVKTKSLEESVGELHEFLFGGRYEGDIGSAEGYQSKEEFINDYYGLTSGPVPRFFNGNRGDKILKQTISVDADVQTNPSTAPYLEKFFRSQREDKKKIYDSLFIALRSQLGVGEVAKYVLSGSQPSVFELDESIKRLIQVVDAREVTINLDPIFQIPSMGALSAPKNITELARSMSAESEQGGTSTQASVAPTQQGIALPQTTTTTAEVEKK